MISEKTLAVVHTSFWQTVTPLAERYMRVQNAQLEHFAQSMPVGRSPKSRGVTNELAFRIFCACHSEGLEVSQLSESRLANLASSAADFIRRFREFSRRDVDKADSGALGEARTIAERLLHYFRRYQAGDHVEVRPRFPGVGILDSCEGDVLAGGTLYEVKAAERTFRVVDLRQVLTYCALNHAAGTYRITHAALLNPRTGAFFTQSLERLAREVSGTTHSELFAEIVEYVGRSYDAPQADLGT